MSEPKTRGRPTKYYPGLIKLVGEYLKECQDEYESVVKQANEEKGYEMFAERLKVSMPTRIGFANLIDVDDETLIEWGKKYIDFSAALRKIDREQYKRLVNSGLSGQYNPTIAKLLLTNNHGMKDQSETTFKVSDEDKEDVNKAVHAFISRGNSI